MGQDLYSHNAAAKEIFDTAGEQIKGWCFEGTKEMLRQTHITQPSIYTVTMAAYSALRQAVAEHPDLSETIEIEGIAGFSLGEYCALTAANVITDIGLGQEIVSRRGQLMFDAGKDKEGNQRGGMVAAFGKRKDICQAAEEAKKDRILAPVNFNSSIQTVVAGEKAALDDFVALCEERRIKAKKLSVSTAFHSQLMIPAAEALKPILQEANLQPPTMKIYANVTGRDMMADFAESGETTAEYLADLMAKQAMSPVYWQETIENMIADGVEAFIEVGPGHTLSGLIKKVSRKAVTMNVENMETLEKTMEKLSELVNAGETTTTKEA